MLHELRRDIQKSHLGSLRRRTGDLHCLRRAAPALHDLGFTALVSEAVVADDLLHLAIHVVRLAANPLGLTEARNGRFQRLEVVPLVPVGVDDVALVLMAVVANHALRAEGVDAGRQQRHVRLRHHEGVGSPELAVEEVREVLDIVDRCEDGDVDALFLHRLAQLSQPGGKLPVREQRRHRAALAAIKLLVRRAAVVGLVPGGHSILLEARSLHGAARDVGWSGAELVSRNLHHHDLE
mmetsp:Transcript_43960/g.104032  ORF Transcript_43960/g.104032 Transcript_43960/m.104032 type:complete len:238 (+) Transcript_43960:1174-1887(+)